MGAYILRHRGVFVLMALLGIPGFMTGCNSQPADEKVAATPKNGKSKMGLVFLGDIRSELKNAKVTAVSHRGERTLKKGDALLLGEEIRCGKNTQAEIRFDGRADVLLDEDSVVALQGHPTMKLISGNVTISRQVGAPAPFVVGLNEVNYSIIQGKMMARQTKTAFGAKIVSGEILRIDTNEYFGTGDRIGKTDGNTPPKGQSQQQVTADSPASKTVALAPPDWHPPISPLEQDVAIPVMSKAQQGIGTLFARNPRTNKTAQNAMKMNAHHVNVQIQEGVAITQVEEQFTNMSNVTVEATYRFLVPKDAEITRLALDVNGRIEEGEVLEKKRAAKIFKQIVDDSVRPKDPALLEWERGSEFKMKIFPIKPNETRRVFLTYTTPLNYYSGYYRYEYPLANPRGTAPVETFSFKADIRTPRPMRNLRTPLFQSTISRQENRATLTYETRNRTPVRDFVITFETDPSRGGMRSLMQTEKNGQSFGMFLWQPETASAPVMQRSPRRVVAMVDVSYGISSEMIALSAATLVEMIGGLGHTDRFNVLACDDSCRPIFHEFKAPGAAAIIQMYRRIVEMTPGGASNLLGNFQQAFATVGDLPGSAVVYLGDGIPTSGEMNSKRLVDMLKETRPDNIRVHTVGVGPGVDSKVLGRIAAQLDGMNYNLSFGDSPASASWHLSRMFAADALVDVRAELTDETGREYTLYPARVGFLPMGQSLQLMTQIGNLPKGSALGATLSVTARRLNGQKVQKRYQIRLAPSAPAPGFVSRLWAAKRIADLEFSGDNDQAIVNISKTYRIASRLTSWIVLENQRMYDRFNVTRTDSEPYDMTAAAPFDEAAAEASPELDDLMTPASEKKPNAAPRKSASGRIDDGDGGSGRARAASSAAGATPKRKSETSAADPLSGISEERTPAAPQRRAGRKKKTSVQSGWPPPRSLCHGPRYDIKVSAYTGVSTHATSKLNQIKSELDAHRLSRALHRRYVRQLAKMDNRQAAMEAANTWREIDAFSAAAIRAYAAEVARSGHRERAVRLYAGISEVMPRESNFHRRIGLTWRDMGDFAAAAGHYGALWSISREGKAAAQKSEDLLNYLFALVMSGQHRLFQAEMGDVQNAAALEKIRKETHALSRSLTTGIVPDWPAPSSGGALKISLSAVDEDLDLMLIDPYGRVMSGLWQFGTTVSGLTEKGAETLRSSNLLNGNYQIIVVRPNSESDKISRGSVTITLRDETKKIPFEFDGSSATVGKLSYRKYVPRECYRY